MNIHPGAIEINNSIDDDCDGSIDEGFWNNVYVRVNFSNVLANSRKDLSLNNTLYNITLITATNTSATINVLKMIGPGTFTNETKEIQEWQSQLINGLYIYLNSSEEVNTSGQQRFFVFLTVSLNPIGAGEFLLAGGAACKNECTPTGNKTCSGTNTYQTCGNYDKDKCTEWSSSTSCSSGYVCQLGGCVLNRHKVCSGSYCITISGPGVDECITNSTCQSAQATLAATAESQSSICSRCGEGWFNICDQTECETDLGVILGGNCQYIDGTCI
jgi:hypothetical protein